MFRTHGRNERVYKLEVQLSDLTYSFIVVPTGRIVGRKSRTNVIIF